MQHRPRARENSSGLNVRGFIALVVFALALVLPPVTRSQSGDGIDAVVPQYLLDAATLFPTTEFDVIVQGDGTKRSDAVANRVAHELAKDRGAPSEKKILRDQVKRQFRTIDGVQIRVTGKQLLKLAKTSGIAVITGNTQVSATAYTNPQKWPVEVGVPFYASSAHAATTPATIAVVDSGVSNTDDVFGNRVLTQVSFVSEGENSAGDGHGHGTFVAGIAAGGGSYAGVAPTAKIVSLDVISDAGTSKTSDVIAAVDWIYANKEQYGIKVANLSLHAGVEGSFMYDPLDKAVERLWNSGVFVVAAAGNYNADGRPSGVPYAPGNDPLVMTVGALDVNGNTDPADDFAAPWSAYGYTRDGFAKPDVGAPGRHMIATVPPTGRLYAERTAARVSPTQLQLSGTSFSAPMVAGMGAVLMGVHPEWTPDQVKGALMVTATPLPNTAPLSSGVGIVDLKKALELTTPPNGNEALAKFLVADPAGGPTPVLDTEEWRETAEADASWASASWASASWASASWASASWASASWASASWASAVESAAAHLDSSRVDRPGGVG